MKGWRKEAEQPKASASMPTMKKMSPNSKSRLLMYGVSKGSSPEKPRELRRRAETVAGRG